MKLSLVVEAFVAKRLVVVELVTVKLVIVEVEELNRRIVPEALVRSSIVALEIVVVARVVVPVTTKVLVEVASVTVNPSMKATVAWKKSAKRLDEEANRIYPLSA